MDPLPSLEIQSMKREGSRKLAAKSCRTILCKPRPEHRSAFRMRIAWLCGRHPDASVLEIEPCINLLP